MPSHVYCRIYWTVRNGRGNISSGGEGRGMPSHVYCRIYWTVRNLTGLTRLIESVTCVWQRWLKTNAPEVSTRHENLALHFLSDFLIRCMRIWYHMLTAWYTWTLYQRVIKLSDTFNFQANTMSQDILLWWRINSRTFLVNEQIWNLISF